MFRISEGVYLMVTLYNHYSLKETIKIFTETSF